MGNHTNNKNYLSYIMTILITFSISFLPFIHSYYTIESLNNKLETSNKLYEELLSKYNNLSGDFEEYKNSDSKLIIEIRNEYENKNYEQVLILAKKLHQISNGSELDIEAQKYVEEIENIKLQIEKEKKEQATKTARDILRIKKVITSTPNSAGGVDLNIHWTNMSDKTIKYIVFTVNAYNAVDDIVYSDIGYSKSAVRVQETGPIKKGDGNKSGYLWSNTWYNSTISYAKIKEIEIEYMDGTTCTLSQDQISYITY